MLHLFKFMELKGLLKQSKLQWKKTDVSILAFFQWELAEQRKHYFLKGKQRFEV